MLRNDSLDLRLFPIKSVLDSNHVLFTSNKIYKHLEKFKYWKSIGSILYIFHIPQDKDYVNIWRFKKYMCTFIIHLVVVEYNINMYPVTWPILYYSWV